MTNRQDTLDPQMLENPLIKGNHDPEGIRFIQVRRQIRMKTRTQYDNTHIMNLQ
jgi:hypothetical protein